jgi:hypothetical protein
MANPQTQPYGMLTDPAYADLLASQQDAASLQKVMQSTPAAPPSGHLAHVLNTADNMGGPVAPAPPPQPKVVLDQDPQHQQEGHLQNALNRDYEKDANPYGSPTNHPGFFGKLAHALSHATGGDTRRQWEEQGLAHQLNDIKSEEAKNALEGAQTNEAQQRAKNSPVELAERAGEQGLKLNDQGQLVPQTTEEQSPGFKTQEELKQAQIYGLKNPWAKLPDKEPLQNVDDINAGMADRYQVLHPGAELPAHFKLPPNATKGDFERIDKLLNGEESALGSQQQREIANQMRAQTYALAMMKAKEGEGKTDFAQKQVALKTYAPAMDSAERFNVMTDAYEKAAKSGDQQAMLNLLANHLGMTMGLQKGARITKDLYQEAAQSTPWLDKIGAKFDSRGYLSGVTLNKQQMQQMVSLAQQRYGEDVKKARSEGEYIGLTDDGPKRTPNTATINYYKSLAGGNGAKAKELASQDGWTVQ